MQPGWGRLHVYRGGCCCFGYRSGNRRRRQVLYEHENGLPLIWTLETRAHLAVPRDNVRKTVKEPEIAAPWTWLLGDQEYAVTSLRALHARSMPNDSGMTVRLSVSASQVFKRSVCGCTSTCH